MVGELLSLAHDGPALGLQVQVPLHVVGCAVAHEHVDGHRVATQLLADVVLGDDPAIAAAGALAPHPPAVPPVPREGDDQAQVEHRQPEERVLRDRQERRHGCSSCMSRHLAPGRKAAILV
ncbi:MAG: hypothetical protein F4118_05110 [Acidimicrobiaceae bacterium]|nr:hypothetical protein [Acidimicrobiaceae bacterium]MYI35791.1 hypothetical protein [Acidimicrobiaceae bacterium]